MSPLRALPWLLLAVSLAAHARHHLRPAPPSAAPAPRLAAPPLPTAPSTPIHPFNPVAEAGPAPARTDPPSPSATLAAYADILAASLETPEQHQDLARVLTRWIATDPAAASAWLNARPDDPRYDLPVSQVVTHLTASADYARAYEWAQSILTPALRSAALEEILAERYRARLLDETALRVAAKHDGLQPDRTEAILNYSRLD